MTIPILIKTSEINEMLAITPRNPTMDDIINHICFEYGITETELISKASTKPLPDARHLVFFKLMEKQVAPRWKIAIRMNRHIATITQGKNKIKGLYEVDPEIRNQVDKMEFMFN